MKLQGSLSGNLKVHKKNSKSFCGEDNASLKANGQNYVSFCLTSFCPLLNRKQML